jgi:hypothetical protein
VVLIANDETFDNFITFINAETFEVIQKIKFDGTDPNGNNILATALSSAFSIRRTETSTSIFRPLGWQPWRSPSPGATLRISGKVSFKVEKVFDFSKPLL